MAEVQRIVNDFVSRLRKRKVEEGSPETARLTAELLRMVISQYKVPHQDHAAASLVEAVRNVGQQLIRADPAEIVVGNILRRVLHFIREEDVLLETDAAGDNENEVAQEDDQIQSAAVTAARSSLRPPSLHALLESLPKSANPQQSSAYEDDSEGKEKSADNNTRNQNLKCAIIKAINQLIEEINTCHEHIARRAVEHIHHNEVIMTFGHSSTVMEFLCAAKKDNNRSIQVFVAEGSPKYRGHALVKRLAKRGFQATLITDAAVLAMMSRVNLVIVGVHAVMANGGVLAPVGLKIVALAAQRHGVPLVVVAGTHKLCPLHPQNPEVSLNKMRSPSELLELNEFSDCMNNGLGSCSPLLHVVNPTFDYVPPELINIFVMNTGGHNPSYMYRLIADYYSAEDFALG